MKPAREKPFPLESDLAVAVKKRILTEYGGHAFKLQGTPSQTGGHPDIIACIRGRFVGVELKQPGKVPTPRQYKRLRDWAAAGGLAGWATTEVELDSLLSHLDDTSWENPQLDRAYGA